MANVAIEKVRDDGATTVSLFERMASLADKVRQKAFEIFQCHGCQDGRSLDDWLQAEREIIQSPEAELTEKDGKYQIRVAIPGFALKEIRVAATPTALFIDAQTTHEHNKTDGDVHFCEFGQKQIFRRLDLPSAIDVRKIAAKLDQGILQLIVSKAEENAKSIAAA